jgi:hypothetical protein
MLLTFVRKPQVKRSYRNIFISFDKSVKGRHCVVDQRIILKWIVEKIGSDDVD